MQWCKSYMNVVFKTMFSVVFQMLMDPMGGIVMTNDGNAILREVRQWESWGGGGGGGG